MAKQERREKVAQDLKDRPGFGDAPMTPEQFASAVESYISQRLHEADTCEAGARVTDQEFLAAKAALLEILTDHRNTPSQRLRAVEFLAALPEIFEQLQWAFVI